MYTKEEKKERFNMELLKVEHCTKIYGEKEAKVIALDDVSFSVNHGEFVAIVGPSGSGKSTLLHMLGGVDTPTSGKVIVDDTSLYDLDETKLAIFRRRHLGLIYQFYNLIPILDVSENILLPALLDQQTVNQERFDDLVNTLAIHDRLSHLPNQLSGGQQQRVSIARALINQPALILADEPTGNLDRKNSEEIIQLLRLSNRKYNQTIIMITHDHSIAELVDRVITIEDGKIVSDERKIA